MGAMSCNPTAASIHLCQPTLIHDAVLWGHLQWRKDKMLGHQAYVVSSQCDVNMVLYLCLYVKSYHAIYTTHAPIVRAQWRGGRAAWRVWARARTTPSLPSLCLTPPMASSPPQPPFCSARGHGLRLLPAPAQPPMPILGLISHGPLLPLTSVCSTAGCLFVWHCSLHSACVTPLTAVFYR